MNQTELIILINVYYKIHSFLEIWFRNLSTIELYSAENVYLNYTGCLKDILGYFTHWK